MKRFPRRTFCADYSKRHKQRIEKGRNFRSVKTLNVAALKKVLLPEEALRVRESDFICQNCYRRFKEDIDNMQAESTETFEEFRPGEEIVENLNSSVSLTSEISPLKPPSALKKRLRLSYAKRKQEEVARAMVTKIRSGIQAAYNIPETSRASQEKCAQCSSWEDNLHSAYNRCTSFQERCQLLTLLPRNLTVKYVQEVIPEATRYVIQKSKKMVDEDGVWSTQERYTRCKLQHEDITTVLEYYTMDELDCSRQTPNKKDVVRIEKEGEKEWVPKRFMTRSLREAFRLYKQAHPASQVGLTKFISLRPKWVKCSPQWQVCVCVCCANFQLCLVGLQNASGRSLSPDDMQSLCVCQEPTASCFLRNCEHCPQDGIFTLENFDMSSEDEVLIASWEYGELVKKTLTASSFMREFLRMTMKWIPHNYIRSVQAKAIHEEKQSCERGAIVLHFDFAENWTVVLPDAVQAYHWQKKQVTVFTCVVTSRKSTQNYAVISDDMSHDSAHACLALSKIKAHLEDNAPIYTKITHVSDGAPAHFKNKYQFHELQRSECQEMKWMFSATGHGKNACDGVGGLVKHRASHHNLRKPASEAIQTASGFVDAIQGTLKNITILELPQRELADFREMKKEEWKTAKKVPGVQTLHMWKYVQSNGGSASYVASTAASEWKRL
ncbi:uncharacterized protein LOC142588499 [Dermacentor variabilis]|uniref:uncharacterized protein LOC142557607 n=1 Tax=Dermacentor variabilis TaxID=34621 RepID=UPI003F5AF2D7